jgi:predicted Zn-dependent protease
MTMNQANSNMTYTGGAFYNRAEGIRAFGKITVSPNELLFEGGEFRTALPLQGLAVKAGGAGDRMIFFSHSGIPDCTIFTSDHAVLNDGNLRLYADMIRQTALIRKNKKNARIFIIAVMVLLTGMIYGIFKLKEPVCDGIAKQIPASWEEKFGDMVLSRLKSGKQTVDDPEIKNMLEQFTSPFLSRIPEKRYQLKLHIVKDPEINAFALPGGHIVFHTGLILNAKSPEELLGVLAHETAHVALQHGLRSLIASSGIFILAQAFFGDTSGLLAVIADKGLFLLTQKYSRDYEREADDKGWEYLVHANINPYGMIAFFNTLAESQEKGILKHIEGSLNILSTHPATEERIDYLQEKWKKLNRTSGYSVFPNDFRKFQDKIKNLG